MSKLKKLFGSHDKDDEIMYGTPSKGKEAADPLPTKLQTDPEAEKQNHGILRQVLNPGGEKHSEQSYGKTATAATEDEQESKHVETDPVAKEESKIESAPPSAVPSTTVSRLKEDDGASCLSMKSGVHGPYAGATDNKSAGDAERSAKDSDASAKTADDSHLGKDAAIGAGAVGVAGVGAAVYESKEKSDEPKEDSLAKATEKENAHPLSSVSEIKPEETSSATVASSSEANSAEKSSGAAAIASSKSDPAEELSSAAATTSSKNTPTEQSSRAAPDESDKAIPTEESHLGRDAAIAGAGAGVVGAGAYVASKKNDEITPETKTREIQKPEELDSASRLGPHLPGEFPTETGEDPHHIPGSYPITPPAEEPEETSRGIASTIGGGAAADESVADEKPLEESSDGGTAAAVGSGTAADESGADKKLGEESGGKGTFAAIGSAAAAVAGAAGIATYEATKSDSKSSDTKTHGVEHVQREHFFGRPQASHPSPPKHYNEDHHYGSFGLPEKRSTQGSSQPITKEEDSPSAPKQEESHHNGRDAAIAAGAVGVTGAAGAAAYEGIDRRDTGPASKTIGPHESNIKNILDPRVKPDPAKQKEKEPLTQGPHKSDVANIMDPRVKDSTPKPQADEMNYGRDAAVVSGATAAGAGTAYAATSEKSEDAASGSRASTESPHSPNSHHNKVSTDQQGHHHLHKKRVEEQGEKKPGLISRILHRDKNKENRKSSGGSHEVEKDGETEEGVESGKSEELKAGGLPLDDQGAITLVNEGASEDAPHVTVKDNGEGSEAVRKGE